MQLLQIVHRAARKNSLRHRQELLEQPAHGRGFRSLVAARRPRWHRAPTPRCPLKTVTVRGEALTARAGAKKLGGKLEVIFRPDPTIYDGRFANNGWLQELPKPITKLTWDNAAILSPATAHRFGVQTGDMLKLTYDGRSLNAPVFIQPGHVERRHHAASRLRPHARRTRRHRHGLQPLRTAHRQGALAGCRPGRREDRRQVRIRLHAEFP